MDTRPTVAFADLQSAFDWIAAGSLMRAEAYIDLRDGRVWCVSEDAGIEEAKPPPDLDSGHYLAVPDKRNLDLGRQLAFDFARRYLPRDFDRVRAMFHRRGAYGRFRELVEARGLRQQWFDFRDAAERHATIAWAESNGLRVVT